MQDYVIITGIVLIGLVAILLYLYLSVRPVLAYLYVNTLLQSRSGRFLTQTKTQKLVECDSLREFVNELTGTFYEVDGAELQSIHRAFTHKYVQLLEDIKKHTPVTFVELIDTYTLLLESAVIRYMYKSRFLGKPLDEKNLVSYGHLTKKQLHAMKEAEDFDEFRALFSQTLFRKIMLENHATLDDFDIAMDAFISNQVLTKLKKTKVADKKVIRDLFMMIFDQHNIMLCVQSIVRQSDVHYISGGFVSTTSLKKVKTVDELAEVLSKTMYKASFTKAKEQYDETKSAAAFEIELERFILQLAQKEVLSKPQGAFSVLVHLLQAKRDKQNVQIISKCIEAKLPVSKIKEMII